MANARDLTADTWSWSAMRRDEGVQTPDQPERIAGRYRLLDLLGRGGHGEVWRARDELLDEDVAIKLVSAGCGVELGRARREAVALRWARLPGVVGLRDDGHLGEDWFLVMDLVQGQPFPGGPAPMPWATLGPLARRLVEVLAGLHAAGVVHRDIKPANVLVEPGTDHVVLVDLGLAVGRPVDHAPTPGHFAGTPRYASPEQILGQPLDGRSDLYAVGIMLFQALSGLVPHERGDGHLRQLGRRLREPAPPLATLCPDAPAVVCETVDRLLARDPAARPDSAWEVLTALGGRLPPPLSGELPLPEGRAATPDELWALFHGPDHFLHLREDAAAALWARTGGQPDRVREELGHWLRAGLAVWDQGAARLDRPAIERLLRGERVGAELRGSADPVATALSLAFPDGSVPVVAQALALPEPTVQARVQALVDAGDAWPLPDGRLGCRPLLGGPDPATCALRRTLAAALPARHPGRLRLLAEAGASAHELVLVARAVLSDPDLSPGEAGAVIERALQVARLEGQATLEAELLCELSASALHMEAAGPLRQVLYEVGRGIAAGLALEPVETLLRAVLHAVSGDLARGRALLEQVPPQAHEELELFRAGTVAYCARVGGLEEEERELQALEAWAGQDGERRARLAGWWGNHLYSRGRFAEAAARHEVAAAGKRGQVGRLASEANQMAALLEVPELEQAARIGASALQETSLQRLSRLELKIVCLRVVGAYRGKADLGVGSDVPAQAVLVREHEAALIALYQAADAWRRGQAGLGIERCRTARTWAARCGSAGLALLAGALELLLGGEVGELDALIRAADAHPLPAVRVQALHLLGRGAGRADLLARARELARSELPPHRTQLELLTLDEILHPPARAPGA